MLENTNNASSREQESTDGRGKARSQEAPATVQAGDAEGPAGQRSPRRGTGLKDAPEVEAAGWLRWEGRKIHDDLRVSRSDVRQLTTEHRESNGPALGNFRACGTPRGKVR